MDKMEEFNDRLYIPYSRGFNNPHLVGMAKVEGGVTIRVKHIASYAATGMVERMAGLGDE